MKVISIEHSKKSKVLNVTYGYAQAIEKQRAKEIGKELQKGYMKLLSNFK